MAIAYQSAGSGNSAGTAQLSVAITSNAGEIIFAVLGWGDIASTPTITDGVNTYSTLLGPITNSGLGSGGLQSLQVYWAASAGGSLTVQDNSVLAGVGRALAVVSYSGLQQVADGTNSNTGITGNSLTSGNVTTTNANDLLLGVFFCRNANTFTAGSGYTMRQTNSATIGVEEQIVAATSTYSASATSDTSGSQNWEAGIVTAKASGGASFPPDDTSPFIARYNSIEQTVTVWQ